MRHFYLDSSPTINSVVTIQESEAHHIKNVLRLKPGNTIKLFDGTGFEYEAVIKEMSAAEVKVEIRSRVRATLGSGVQIMVAQAFLKEKKMDELVRKLCELGVARWIPFFFPARYCKTRCKPTCRSQPAMASNCRRSPQTVPATQSAGDCHSAFF